MASRAGLTVLRRSFGSRTTREARPSTRHCSMTARVRSTQHHFEQPSPNRLILAAHGTRDFRIPSRLCRQFEHEHGVNFWVVAPAPGFEDLEYGSAHILGTVKSFGHLVLIGFEMTLNDGLDHCALAVEVAVDKSGAHVGGLRDARHAGGVKAALDEAALGGIENAFALASRARLDQRRGRAHGLPLWPWLCSRQPPPRASYKVTRLLCSASRVAISPCCAV